MKMTIGLTALVVAMGTGVSSLLVGCAQTPSKQHSLDEPIPIHHLGEASKYVASSAGPVLVVLDIDDTLLTTPPEGSAHRKFFGSDRWFSWQNKLRAEPGNPARVPCLGDVNGMIYELGSQVPSDGEAGVAAVNALTADRIALTSRNPRSRGPTEREWRHAGYNDLPMLRNAKGEVLSSVLIDGWSYEHGVYMTGGGNKGDALKALLPDINRYATVVMVDDGPKNLQDVRQALQGLPSPIPVVALQYMGVKEVLPPDLDPHEISEAQTEWGKLRTTLSEAFPDRWARIDAGQCDLTPK
ncbi:DUF2608 domain-containing protein [Dokdonella sp.]|uniref:DUF2608 domain-containing protein n=1 Tax=Dokdonella sp. TaxID=2291710 RepID=UPI0037840397